jgi:predicted CXXCH cytochrome family protein
MPHLPRRRVTLPLAIALLTALIVVADWWHCHPAGETAHYVGGQKCVACHEKEYDLWLSSDHDRAMDLATVTTVVGDFDNQSMTYQGVTSRMFRRDGDFFVHTEGPDGKLHDYRIKYTFGVRPLQQYMVELPDGRVQVLRISWDTQRQQWIYVPPPDVTDQKIPPGDPLHWTGVAQNWNHTCAECHSTDLQKNYDAASNTFHTTFSDIDVHCEACHGPGSLHVELAEARSLFWDRRLGYGLVKLKGADPTPQIESCGMCHSRRGVVFPGFRPGDALMDYYDPSLLDETLYYADGQILDEVYVYGSFLQSRMYHEGIRCSDCHDPHSLQLKFQGNRLCSQCHQAGKYDAPAHHHHAIGSVGALCVECHMPEATYMAVDPRRDHSLRIPRPDLTVSIGTPNVCNRCHTKPEETPQWAAAKVDEWYGTHRLHDPHYGVALAGGRRGTPAAERPLLRLLRLSDTPAIVKATAISLLAGYPTRQSAAALDRALTHAHPLVRTAAVRSVLPRPPGQLLKLLAPLLNDPVRTVRTAAAVRLAQVPQPLFSQHQRSAFDKAIAEYRTGQLASADRAATHLNLGNLDQNLGQFKQAAAEFRTAIRLEPYLTGARSNLAALLEGRDGDSAEIKRLREAELELLTRDARLLPDNALVHYRLGLMRYLLGDPAKAQEALESACRLDGDSFDFRMMLTLLYEKRGLRRRALDSVAQLLKLRPGDPAAQQILQRIRQGTPP